MAEEIKPHRYERMLWWVILIVLLLLIILLYSCKIA